MKVYRRRSPLGLSWRPLKKRHRHRTWEWKPSLKGAVLQNFTRQELRAGVALAAQWFPEQVDVRRCFGAGFW